MALLRQLEERRNAFVTGVPPGRPRGKPFVPHLPVFNEVVPGASADFFTVTRMELIRKAMDELLHGLRWFVTYTMLHSSYRKHFLQENVKPIQMYVTGAVVYNAATGESVMQQGKRSLGVNMKSLKRPEELLAHVHELSSGNSFMSDLRQLLRHVSDVAKFPNSYYNHGARESSSLLRDCSIVLAHNNAHMGTDDSFRGIADREEEVICATIQAMRDFLKSVRSNLPKTRRAPKHLAVADLCLDLSREILETPVKMHFDSAHGVLQLADQIKPVVSWHRDTYVTQDHKNLLDLLLVDKAQAQPAAHALVEDEQVALMHLWTRFDIRAAAEPGEGEGGDADLGATEPDEDSEWLSPGAAEEPFDTRNINRLGMTECYRYQVEVPSVYAPKELHLAVHKFRIDPLGITHLDIEKRALDLGSRALRGILCLALTDFPDACAAFAAAAATEADEKTYQLGARVLRLPPSVYALTPRPLKTGSNVNIYVKNNEVVGEAVFEHFAAENSLDQMDPGSICAFVRRDAHWCDPRHLFEFLAGITTPGSASAFPSAQRLIQARDNICHGAHIINPRSKTQTSLWRETQELLQLVNDVASYYAVELPREAIALREVVDAIPLYFRWRSRQYDICTGVWQREADPLAYCQNLARRTVEGLKSALTQVPTDEAGQMMLRRIYIESRLSDASTRSLACYLELLRMCKKRQHRIRQRQRQRGEAGAAEVSTRAAEEPSSSGTHRVRGQRDAVQRQRAGFFSMLMEDDDTDEETG